MVLDSISQRDTCTSRWASQCSWKCLICVAGERNPHSETFSAPGSAFISPSREVRRIESGRYPPSAPPIKGATKNSQRRRFLSLRIPLPRDACRLSIDNERGRRKTARHAVGNKNSPSAKAGNHAVWRNNSCRRGYVASIRAVAPSATTNCDHGCISRG